MNRTAGDRSRRGGYALIDMLVGLTVLGLGLGLAMYAAGQSLRGARQAQSIGKMAGDLAYALETDWRRSLEAGAPVTGKTWSVSTTRERPSVDGEAWSICRVEARVEGRSGARQAVTYRFCPPP